MTMCSTTTPAATGIQTEPVVRDRIAQRDRIRQLGLPIGTKTAGPPPWSWPNLISADAVIIDAAVEEFVQTYNRIHALTVEEIIPQCWRRHPPLAQELPVQFWAWWSSHIATTATTAAAVEYYSRTLPGFQNRLANRLLGKGAATCRKGTHNPPGDGELIKAASFDSMAPEEVTGRSAATRRALHQIDFGTGEGEIN